MTDDREQELRCVISDLSEQCAELRQENKRLNAEADWLADRCDEFCADHDCCGDCIMTAEPSERTKCDGGVEIKPPMDERRVQEWRAAAREAVKREDKQWKGCFYWWRRV